MLSNYAQSAPCTILIVDDDVVIRSMLQRLLEEQGYRIIEAHNGQEALDSFQTHAPDLVLMDAAMPIMDGFTACAEIKRLPEGKNLPIMMITSLYDDSSVDQAFAAGAMEYITKPIHWSALRHRVNVLLKARRAERALAASEVRFRSIFEQNAMGIALVDMDDHLLECNSALKNILEQPVDELKDVNFSLLFHPVESMLEKEFKEELLDGRRAHYQIGKSFIPHGDKERTRWLNLTVSLVADQDGRPQYRIYMVEDISARKKARIKQSIAQKVFENTLDGVVVINAEGRIVDVNYSFTLNSGYSYEEVLDQNFSMLHSNKPEQAFYQEMWEALRNSGRWQGEFWSRRSNGGDYSQWLSISAVRDDAGAATHYVGVFSDLTSFEHGGEDVKRMVHYDERMYHLTNYDALTELPNRLLFHEHLMRACRESSDVALFYIDLENFNAVNENFGFEKGDEVLKEIASRLRSCARDSDSAARLESDEFALILTPVTQAYDIRMTADKLFGALSRPFILDGKEFRINSHIGVSFYPDKQRRQADIATNVELMIQHADLGMYQAKAAGGNAYKLYPEPEEEAVLE